MATHDVIVVGAGPAGSTAARRLAEAGASVLLVDKARFPRPKACGGALSPRVLRLAPPGIEGQFRSRIRRAVFSFCSTRPFAVAADRPLGYMVRREEFDHWLLERAAESGAMVREGAGVRSVEREGTKIAVRFSGERALARVVVGADGAASRVADAVCPHRERVPLMALRAEVAHSVPLADTALVDVGRYPGGYAWAFPVGERTNVGVMVSRAHGRRLEQALDRFLAGCAHLAGSHPAGASAAPVAAFREGAGECAAAGILLVGDAARLADPFLGEGIYYALWSGGLAAEAILAGGDGETVARRYRAAVEGAIWPELQAAGRIGRLFHCMPRWWFQVLSRLPGGILQYAGVLAGEESYRGLVWRVIDRIERRASRWALARLGVGQSTERAQSEQAGEGRHDR